MSVLVVVAVTAIWQSSRDPKPSSQPDASKSSKSDIEPGNLFDQITTSNSLEHLSEVAEGLDEKFKTALLPGRVEILTQLIAIGDRMTVIAKTDQDREAGKKRAIRALNTLFALNWGQRIDQPEIRQRLFDLANELVDSKDSALSINAHMGLIAVSGLELTKLPTSPEILEKFKAEAIAAAKKHPNEYQIAAMIDLFLLALPELNFDAEKFVALQNEIRASYRDVKDFFVLRWLNSLPDRVVFKKHNLDALINDIELDIPGAPAAILEVVPKILEENVSTSGWGRLLSIGNVLETRTRSKEAGQLYQLLEDRIGETDNAELNEIKRGCQTGRARVELVSRKFSYAGNDYENKPFAEADFLGHPVIVVFVTSSSDLRDAKQILVEAMGSLRRDFRMILVCHEMEPAIVKSQLTAKELSLMRLVIDTNRESLFATQCPVDLTPYVILINHLGIVDQIAIQPPQLQSSLNQVVPD